MKFKLLLDVLVGTGLCDARYNYNSMLYQHLLILTYLVGMGIH